MKLFFSYLKIHIKSAFMFTAFTLIFLLIFHLCSLPLFPVMYAFVLCFALAFVIGAFSFAAFCRRHRELCGLEKDISVSLSSLPAPRNVSEEDYVRLIKKLYSEKCRVSSEKDIALCEAADYYTLWAHQIKTPISALGLLLSENETEKREQLFRIEQYVGMALQYARSEEGGSDYVIRPYNIDGIVRQAIRKYAKSFIIKKISLDYKGIDCIAVTDEKWLLFVIEQLLSNSLKYTKAGGVIRVYMSEEEKKTLIIEDSGIGIAQEDLPRICEKGFTGYNGRSDKKSTGIGLYLSKRILSRLGHTLRFESCIGKGTRAYIGLYTEEKTYE